MFTLTLNQKEEGGGSI